MTSILGIYDGHDAGAAIIKGENIYAVNEERLSREKYHRGFPELSIKKVLELSSTEPEELEKIAVAGIYRRKKRLLKLKDGLKDIFSDLNGKLVTVHHHRAHAAGAYFTSGWKDCVVLTLDAAGDGLSSSIFLGENGELKKVAESSYLDSVGDFYASITEMLGFQPMRHEGKIMALAGYHNGETHHDFTGCIEIDGLSFKNHLEVTGAESVKRLSKKIDFPLNKKKECSKILRKGDEEHELWSSAVKAAGSAQDHLERVLREWCENLKKSEMIDEVLKEKICFSGGVAQNVKANRVLKEKFSDCWVFPHMGDGGLALGAALYLNSRLGENKIFWDWKEDLKSVFLGPRYTSEEVKNECFSEREVWKKPEDQEEEIADLLAKGTIVGLFQERMEYGPRALGHRSILMDPSSEDLKDRLNRKLGRGPFQPFSPTILEDHKEIYLKDPDTNKFMTMSFEVTEKAKEDLVGAVHIDGTCRPQVIEKDDDEVFYNVIKRFEERTGIGAVLNTSFNLHGEPIVCSPGGALSSFRKIGLDALSIEDWLIRKEQDE
ncbi:MAG: carbamoyltransferase C-terminal domain-containing protein [Candidatus Natronoplasma sp.]